MNPTLARELELEAASTELELEAGVEREVIGADTRIPVTGTASFPHRLICNLEYDFPGIGRWPMCSGTLIGPRTVLTAGHCIANIPGMVPSRMRVIPGRFGSQEILGSSPVVSTQIAPGYFPASPTDYAVVHLRDPLGSQVGFWTETYFRRQGDPLGTSMAPVPPVPAGSGLVVHLSGYPADKPNNSGCTDPSNARRRCFFSRLGSPTRSRLCGSLPFLAQNLFATASGGMLHYLNDTCPGHSGSPVWVENAAASGGRVMVGVHVSGDDGSGGVANRAVQFTPFVLAQIRQWLVPSPVGTRPTLRRGSSGPSVLTLQTRLNAWLASSTVPGIAPLVLDGIFGSRTDAAVRVFQQRNGLLVDGIVGPLTWGALLSAPAVPSHEASYESGPSSMVRSICSSSSALASRLRRQMEEARRRSSPQHLDIARDRIRRQGATWINRISNSLVPQLDRLSRREVDLVLGCVARVAHAISMETAPLRRLRAAAQRRLRGA